MPTTPDLATSAHLRTSPRPALRAAVLAAAAALATAHPAAAGVGPADASPRRAGESAGRGAAVPTVDPTTPPALGDLPGAPAFDETLRGRLAAALAARTARGAADPGTRHRREDGSPRFTNRLILESSPYLQQHAHNPVDWYPWGDEAFAAARRLGRPVLLSVGYSTCHWCHVMEEESFEDLEIARLLNQRYVAIKVDREQRPDVDAVYMAAVQLATGGAGGWPMTVWLTPDREPFHADTYVPARDGDRGVRTGLLTLLGRLADRYAADPEHLAGAGGRMADRVRASLATPGGDGLPDAAALARAASFYAARFDREHGGQAGAPKFPGGFPVRLLLRRGLEPGGERSTRMAVRTLEGMADGGIHDPIGGGFHRYSTDTAWRVPHFEKMLYDNALLAVAYLEGYQATGEARFAAVVRSTLDYLAREMSAPEGGFYAATDADSAGPGGELEEGRFFTWTPAEVRAAVGEPAAELATARYGVSAAGDLEGRSVLHVERSIDEVARRSGLQPAAVERLLAEADAALLAARARRPPPRRDGQILTSWNGLAISAFALAGRVLDDGGYLGRAERCARFAWDELQRDGRLRRSAGDGAGNGDRGGAQPAERRDQTFLDDHVFLDDHAFLDDYAFLAAGLLDLYEATSEPLWLERAIALQAVLDAHYRDTAGGGYYRTADDHPGPLARDKPTFDAPEPSGNAVALRNLLRLYALTGDPAYRQRAEATLRAFEPLLRRTPWAAPEMLIGLGAYLEPPLEIVVVTAGGREAARPFLRALAERFVPDYVLVVGGEGDDLAAQAKRVPLLAEKVARGGRATAYVCRAGVCKLPATDVATFLDEIERTAALPAR